MMRIERILPQPFCISYVAKRIANFVYADVEYDCRDEFSTCSHA